MCFCCCSPGEKSDHQAYERLTKNRFSNRVRRGSSDDDSDSDYSFQRRDTSFESNKNMRQRSTRRVSDSDSEFDSLGSVYERRASTSYRHSAAGLQMHQRPSDSPMRPTRLSVYMSGQNTYYNRMMRPLDAMNVLTNEELNHLAKRSYSELDTNSLVALHQKVGRIYTSSELLSKDIYTSNEIGIISHNFIPLNEYLSKRLEDKLLTIILKILEIPKEDEEFYATYSSFIEEAKTCYRHLSRAKDLGSIYQSASVRDKEHYLLVLRTLGNALLRYPELEENYKVEQFLKRLTNEEIAKFANVCPPTFKSNPDRLDQKRAQIVRNVRAENASRAE